MRARAHCRVLTRRPPGVNDSSWSSSPRMNDSGRPPKIVSDQSLYFRKLSVPMRIKSTCDRIDYARALRNSPSASVAFASASHTF